MPPLRTAAIPRRLAAAMAAGILVCLAAFALAVGAVRNRVDSSAASDSVRLMAARVGDLRDTLAAVTNEYNHWDEAFAALMARDLPWIAANYASAMTADTGRLFEGLILLGGPFETPLAWVRSSPAEPGPPFLSATLLDRIATEVGRQPLGERATFDALVVVDDQLTLLSATRTQPTDDALLAGLDPPSLPIAVLTNTFDEDDAGAIVDAMSLSGLTFTHAAASGDATLPLHGSDGELLGALAWNPPRPGSAVTAAMAPVLIAAALAFVAVGGVAIWLARALVRRLVGGQVEASRLARTDSLTGLPNRLAFTEALVAPSRAGERAVLFLDLNGFKRINDSIGHAAGDLVIRELARRLDILVHEGCFLARIGGDEFVFVLAGAGCTARAERLVTAIEAALEPAFEVHGHQLRLRSATGYAVQATDDVSGEDLVRQADLAMYAAKRDEADAVAFDAVVERAADGALAVERSLRAALTRRPGEIHLAYQPIVAAGTRRFVRAEALARWTSPVLGIVPPDRFIPVAEQAGLIIELGRRVLLQVCDDLARYPDLRVSLNISPLQLMAPTFVADMVAELAQRDIDPSRIEVELTEGMVVDDPKLAALRLRELRAAGFSTALDDFGTGYSSLGYLDQMAFDCLKIDRSFVSGASDARPSGERLELVRAMVQMGHALGLCVVCEGVETGEELEAMGTLGCDLLQGYHLDRPMSIDQLAARWLPTASEPAAA